MMTEKMLVHVLVVEMLWMGLHVVMVNLRLCLRHRGCCLASRCWVHNGDSFAAFLLGRSYRWYISGNWPSTGLVRWRTRIGRSSRWNAISRIHVLMVMRRVVMWRHMLLIVVLRQ